MAFDIDQRYRIKRNAEHEDQMKYLVQDLKIFQSYSQILTVSAIIGFKNHRYRKIEKSASDQVLMNSFSQRCYDIMNFIAYAHKKEQSVLKDLQQFEIFESYANGGFPILVDKLHIDFVDKGRNDKKKILRYYYSLLLTEGFYV